MGHLPRETLLATFRHHPKSGRAAIGQAGAATDRPSPTRKSTGAGPKPGVPLGPFAGNGARRDGDRAGGLGPFAGDGRAVAGELASFRWATGGAGLGYSENR